MKIKYLIDTFLSPSISVLDWVGRYGGVVKTLYKEVKEKGDKTSIKKFPVACDVSPVDCENQSIFETLVPDDTFKSVVYWEEITPFANIGQTQTKKFNERKFKGTARIVVWLNLPKLGITNCKDGALTIPSLEKILTKQGKIESGAFAGSHLWIIPKQIVQQDINIIFGKYDYPKLKNFFAYPFDFYAIDVDFEMNQCLSNDTTLPVLPYVDCYNNLGVSDCDKIKTLLTDDLLLNCVLPLFDFSNPDTQEALSDQQDNDIVEYGISIATCQQLSENLSLDQSNCLLKLYDFSQQTVLDELTSQQESDLQAALCTTHVLPRYSTLFDGINESVAAPYNSNHEIERTDSCTIDVWVKISAYTLGAIVGKFDYQGTRRGCVVWTINNGQVVFELASNESTGNTVTVISVAQIPLNTWTRITVTYTGNSNASGVLMYFNKVSTAYTVYQNNLTGTTVDATNVIQCGGDSPAGFAGRIYEARVWKNRVLTPAEIAALPTVTDTPIYESDLIYWNKLGQGSIFGETVRVYPDYTGITSGFQSRNMESSDLSTDIPT